MKKRLVIVIVVLLSTLISVISIYNLTKSEKLNYVALGDSVALGQNPYGEITYGYPDFVSNYLQKNNILNSYIKNYADPNYKISSLKNDLLNGKEITIAKQKIDIRKAIRESDILTISIGANDFLENINKTNNLKETVDVIFKEMDETFYLLRKFAKKRIIVVGYHNPFLNDKNEIFDYIDYKYAEICKKYKMIYLNTNKNVKITKDNLPNPNDLHLNMKGYELISDKLIEIIDNNL